MLLLLLFGVHFRACEPEDRSWTVDCIDCFDHKPDSANLIVYLTIDQENPMVPLTFYRGSDTTAEVDWIDTAFIDEFKLYSAIGEHYTIKATYRSGDKTVIAFDEDKMSLKDEGESCGSPCYIVKGGIYDVRLVR